MDLFTSVICSNTCIICKIVAKLAMQATSPSPPMHTNYCSKIEFACAYIEVNHAVSNE